MTYPDSNSTPKTASKSLPIEVTFNEPAKDADAAIAPYAFAVGALTLALSALSF